MASLWNFMLWLPWQVDCALATAAAFAFAYKFEREQSQRGVFMTGVFR